MTKGNQFSNTTHTITKLGGGVRPIFLTTSKQTIENITITNIKEI